MDLNLLNTKINEAGVAVSDADSAVWQGHAADAHAALMRVNAALVAIQQLHDGDANSGGPPPANVPPRDAAVQGPGEDTYVWFRDNMINGDPVKREAFMTQYGLTVDQLNVWINYWAIRHPQ